MQIRGHNFLIPVGADIKREDEVQYKAFDANQLLDKMESARNPINIVILDACRNNPFSRSFRSSATGLAQMEAPVGTYVSFSTAPGRVASDGEGANGLFTQHLLTSLRTPGQKVEDVFKQVRVRVMQESGGQQIPWDSSSLTGDFYFIRPDPAAAPVRIAEPVEPAPKPPAQQAQQARPPVEAQSRVSAPPPPVAAASTPAASTPVTSPPVASPRVASAPDASAPVASAPVASAPAPSAPVASTAVTSAPATVWCSLP